MKAAQSRTMVERMRDAGGRVWFIEASNEGHGVTHPLNGAYLAIAKLDFLSRCLVPAR